MSIDLLVIIAILVLGFVSLGYLMMWLSKRNSNSPVEIEALVNQAFGLSSTRIAEQSKQILASERETIGVDLANKHKMMEELVRELRDELKQRQVEIRSLEQDRVQKFGEISGALEQHRKLTEKLEVSTLQLAKVLSNNQSRGAWGERIIEDIMHSNGLVEGVHYVRQTKLGESALRPDVTLLLPNNRFVAVDVKFPYSEIQKMQEAETAKAREEHLKQFEVDLKNQIKKVAAYIEPELDTLDYAILFVPNETVFSFINQKYPHIIDQAMQSKVIMVSPFTFLIVARTVIESYRNFMMEDKLREVIKHISVFVGEWVKFKDQFDKYGRAINSLKIAYDELSTTRVRQLDKRIDKINTYQQGNLIEKSDSADPLLVPPLS